MMYVVTFEITLGVLHIHCAIYYIGTFILRYGKHTLSQPVFLLSETLAGVFIGSLPDQQLGPLLRIEEQHVVLDFFAESKV